MNDFCNDKRGGDKLTHLIVSFVLMCVLGTILAHLLPGMPWVALAISLAVCLAVGVAKEVYDCRRPGNHFCVWDIVADAVGALVGTPLAWLAAWGMTATF